MLMAIWNISKFCIELNLRKRNTNFVFPNFFFVILLIFSIDIRINNRLTCIVQNCAPFILAAIMNEQILLLYNFHTHNVNHNVIFPLIE